MHPDKLSISTNEDRVRAAHAFQNVQSAHEVLRHPDKRAAYDEGLWGTEAGEDSSSNAAEVYDIRRH
jgi:DnaJ-class molecular chaperone